MTTTVLEPVDPPAHLACLSPLEFAALLTTREILPSRKHVRVASLDRPAKSGFNMCIRIRGPTREKKTLCNTVCCIGGTMELLLGRELSFFDPPLKALFIPRIPQPWDDITPREAVAAIDNFVATGDPRWPEVVAARGAGLWRAANCGVGKRIHFVCRDRPERDHGEFGSLEYALGTRGRLRRFATWEAARRVAVSLNAALRA